MKLDKELKLQKEQYETTIFGHLSFIDQVGAPCWSLPSRSPPTSCHLMCELSPHWSADQR